jgi:hypothetical protein
MPRSDLFAPEKDPVPIVQEAGWASGPVWTGAEYLAPTRIRSQDRPTCSKSLYWLWYPDIYILVTQQDGTTIPRSSNPQPSRCKLC